MSMHIQIDSGIRDAGAIRFLLAATADEPHGIPSGKMITDSEKLSFVYLLEVEEGYRQLHFTQAMWPFMVDVLKLDADPILSWQDKGMTLAGFKDELTMLIYNIEGNDNYGEAFSTAVEQAFREILNNAD